MSSGQNTNEKSADLLNKKHSELIDGYFKNKNLVNSTNIDNWINNTIKGTRSVIEAGNMNRIDGDENRLNGTFNNIT